MRIQLQERCVKACLEISPLLIRSIAYINIRLHGSRGYEAIRPANAELSSPPFGAWARRTSRHDRHVIKHMRCLMLVAMLVIPLFTHASAHRCKSSHRLGGDRARSELQVSVVDSSGVPRRHNSLKKKLRPAKLLEVCRRFFSSNELMT